MLCRYAPLFLVLLFLPAIVEAAVTIIPATPTNAQRITIRVSNQFISDARVTSTSISQSGNTFTIQQMVTVTCGLPNAPVITSEFQIGPLLPGRYLVVAHINVTEPCVPFTSPETAQFDVSAGADVPALTPFALLLLGATLSAVAFTMLGR